jgi:hypothetical protein
MPPGGGVGLAMRDALVRRLGHGDTTYINGKELGREDIEWLHGVKDAGGVDELVEDAEALIDAIRKHERIKITVEY